MPKTKNFVIMSFLLLNISVNVLKTLTPRDRRIRLKRMSLVSVVDKIRKNVGGLICNYILKTSVPKIEDFESE